MLWAMIGRMIRKLKGPPRGNVVVKVIQGDYGATRLIQLISTAKGAEMSGDKGGETVLIMVEGGWDNSITPQIRKIAAPLLTRRNVVQIILDLSKVPHMDSSGVATLVDWFQQTRDKAIRFTLAGVRPNVEAQLELDHLRDIFHTVSPVELAVGRGDPARAVPDLMAAPPAGSPEATLA